MKKKLHGLFEIVWLRKPLNFRFCLIRKLNFLKLLKLIVIKKKKKQQQPNTAKSLIMSENRHHKNEVEKIHGF